ncbi:protein PHTF2-like isoform X1 [Macrobrachium nipponense]|uniref:protein PHTF2-like isoform X1 n=1 Tax=Macrobrachium nipponense TaxID=159736 RepID=UPI0030C86AC5
MKSIPVMNVLKKALPPFVIVMLESALGWYQGRISLYDKQSWETTVEQRILQGLSYTPRKTTKLKTELIDVDLVRGSTFPKAKPQSGIWLAGFKGIIRLVFLPLYGRWWIQETSCTGFLTVLFLYLSVLFSMVIMFSCRHDHRLLENVPASEVYLPGVALLILSVIHSQIVCTRNSGIFSSTNKSRPMGMRQSRKIRLVRRSSSLSGRGKCIFCNNGQPPDKSRPHSSTTSKKHLTVLKNKPSLKMFRSHSEEPRQEETYPLEPRSSSENNVSPGSSKERPNIIIIQPSGERGKQDEAWSSSAPTSSSERSPVISQVNSIIDPFTATKVSKSELDGKDISMASQVSSCSDPFDVTGESRSEANSKCKNVNSVNFCSEELMNAIKKPRDSFIQPGVDSEPLFNSKVSDLVSDVICQESFPPSKQKLLKPGKERESDGESGTGDVDALDSNSDGWNLRKPNKCARCSNLFIPTSDGSGSRSKRGNLPPSAVERSSCNSSCESDAEQSPSSQYSKSKLSEYEWTGITTNSDDLSYSSESEGGWDDTESLEKRFSHSEALDWNIQGSPAAIITSTSNVSDKVSCKIFEGADLKKVDLSVLDISSAVISKVDSLQHNTYYLQFGLVMAVMISLVPSIYRLDYSILGETLEDIVTTDLGSWHKILLSSSQKLFDSLFGRNIWVKTMVFLCMVNRFLLASGFFFLLSVAERTFKQRFLYAKHFCYLTSARRARKYDLPHFRLNKVHNIKTWLSVRSCLKKRGPQRSVDVIVSATFFLTLLLVSYLCFDLLKEDEKSQHSLYNIELFFWCFPIGIYLIRFTTLGAMINKKYSSLSILITEQINMYLHMEQKPQKKDELMLANNVLKLVSVLLKELESPFKISGISANPLLYNITRLVVLSACSGVLSDLLGFKLKLHKIKFEE